MSGSNVIQLSPNTKNLLVGKGFMIFKPDGESDYFHLGNCPSLTITPKTTTLDHFDAQQGIQERDLQITTQKTLDAKIQMEEFTKNNLRLLMLGDIDDTDPDKPIVNLFSQDSITGHLKYYAANSKGPRWYIDLPSITINPSGSWDPISTGFANMEVTGSVNSVSGVWGTAQLQPAVGTVVPEYIFDPFIEGAPNVGDTLTANVGAVIGATSFTYLWKANGGSAGGTATGKTYVPVTGDVGKDMTVIVTAHNGIGATLPKTSAAVGPVTEY